MDWLTEKNLDQEDRFDEARQEARAGQPETQVTNGQAATNGGGIDVVVNPDLRIPDRPEWFEWRAELARNCPRETDYNLTIVKRPENGP